MDWFGSGREKRKDAGSDGLSVVSPVAGLSVSAVAAVPARPGT